MTASIFYKWNIIKWKCHTIDVMWFLSIFNEKEQKHIKMMSKTLKNTSKWCYYGEKDGEASIYDIELRKRVCDIIFEQMRKYPYLFN